MVANSVRASVYTLRSRSRRSPCLDFQRYDLVCAPVHGGGGDRVVAGVDEGQLVLMRSRCQRQGLSVHQSEWPQHSLSEELCQQQRSQGTLAAKGSES